MINVVIVQTVLICSLSYLFISYLLSLRGCEIAFFIHEKRSHGVWFAYIVSWINGDSKNHTNIFVDCSEIRMEIVNFSEVEALPFPMRG